MTQPQEKIIRYCIQKICGYQKIQLNSLIWNYVYTFAHSHANTWNRKEQVTHREMCKNVEGCQKLCKNEQTIVTIDRLTICRNFL